MASSSTTQKPSSSSSAPSPKLNFDVFLSFRGEDTRYGFTDHLFVSLEGKGIHTFRDDKLERGEEIGQELLGTIEGSRFSIIVFSERYADSEWCLEELTKIMECRKESGQTVLPVFYHVDPSDLRKQTASFGKGFAKHEKTVDEEKVGRWRAAMTEATNLGGWHVVKDKGYESKPIQEIIDFILKGLKPKFLPIEEHMVGMKFYLKKLKSMLQIHLGHIYVIGIFGFGGIGKTTIAKMVYNDILCQFNGSCFIEGVKNRFECRNDEHRLVQEVLCGLGLNCIADGVDMIKDRLNSGKFLVVIDDVDHWDQVQPLIKHCIWFSPGSRIIITTRDKHLINMCQVDESIKVLFYEVDPLCDEEAIELFSWHAFKQNVPKEDYMNLAKRMANYAKGHPLALKVLGSCLYGKTIDEWKSELDKLKKCPKKEVNDLLRVSFKGLDDFEKNVFLDIACFFIGTNKDFVLEILDGCDFYATSAIPNLHDRCLITIVDNGVQMHDLIQQMGWTVVREEYPRDPSKWSRLWDPNDIHKAFSAKKMKNIETISLDLSRSKEMRFTSEVFSKMKNMFVEMKELRLLKVYYSDHRSQTTKENKIRLPIDFEFPPNLRYFHWEGLEILLSNLQGQNLVALNLKSSNIKELWEGDKDLPKLKFLDLSYSQQLMKIPKFTMMQNLERLNLGGCTGFYELHSSIGAFPRMKFLKELNFSWSGIKELPNSIGCLESLETLKLIGCLEFENFPEMHGNMKCLKRLDLTCTRIKELPNIIGCLGALEFLSLVGCSHLEKLPEFQSNMGSLRFLNLESSAIKELPRSISHLTSLHSLKLENSAIKDLPYSIGHLSQLNKLTLQGCKNLTSLPSSIYKLRYLNDWDLNGCSNLEAVPEIMEDMEHVSAKGITELPSSIGRVKELKRLSLDNCGNLETLPNIIAQLTKLDTLSLVYCRKLHNLHDTLRKLQHCLVRLDIRGCNLSKEAIPSDLWCLSSLVSLNVSENNIRRIPNSIIDLSQLETLYMNHCPMLEEIPNLPSSLRSMEAYGCPYLQTLSSSDPTHLLWSNFVDCFRSLFQVLEKGVSRSSKINVVIPGSCGIPKWVSYKSMGHEIRILLPENCYEDNNFFGFALFFYLVPFDDDPTWTIYGRAETHNIQFVISDDDQFQLTKTIDIEMNWKSIIGLKYGSENFIKSSTSSLDPALGVVYFPHIFIATEYRSNRWNKIKVRFEGPFGSPNIVAFNVESCGIHLIYYDDAQQSHQLLNLKRSHHDTEDHHPQHKKSRQV